MNFIFSIGTLNLNSSNSDVNRSLLRDFVLSYDVDVLFLQEVIFENFGFLSTHTALINLSSDKNGTGVLVRKGIDFHSQIFDPSGRVLSIIINGINFINVYAHSGTSKKKMRDELFENQLTVHLSKSNCKHSVLLGDFNCFLEASDTNSAYKNFSTGLRSCVNLCKFVDVTKFLKKDQFTFFRGESASRLDRFYGPKEFANQVSDVQTVAVACSDHSAVVLKIRVDRQEIHPKGRGYWKINPNMIWNTEVSQRFRV